MIKKGVSNVLSTVIMVSLVVVLMVFLWGFVNTLVEDETEQAGNCYDALNKIKIIDQYTCYNTTSKELYFAIGLEDIKIEKISVNVMSNYEAKNFDLTYSSKIIPGLYKYGDSLGDAVTLPPEDSAQTYVLNLTNASLPEGIPDAIELIPEYEEKCQTADYIRGIEKCIA